MVYYIMTGHSYINDFLYFVVRHDENRGKGALICCSGVNLERFALLTKGRHGLGPSPAMRGLQIVRLGVSALAIAKGATPKTLRGNDCAGIAPTKDSWYTELLLIENAPVTFPDEIIRYSVARLIESIFRACRLELPLPDKLPVPDELQKIIEEQCSKYAI